MILAINTASSQTAIALLQNGKILAEDSWQSQSNEAEKLMPAIHQLLQGKAYSDIQKIIVVKGPGSFTGLRIGVTVANTIAHLTGADLHAIDTFQYHWKKAHTAEALLIFAGRRGVYLHLPDQEPQNINLDDLNERLQGITQVFGDITPAQKEILTTKFLESNETFAETILKFDLNTLPKEKIIQPRYIKSPNITQPKK